MDVSFIYEEHESSLLKEMFNTIKDVTEMSFEESCFLNGLLHYFKPKKILEVGVAAGASSYVILNAIKQEHATHLYSIDISRKYYQDHTKLSGWKAKELFPETPQWDLRLGKDVSEVIEEIGKGIDFLLLDTVHIHPAETLSFLSIFPYLTYNAVVVLHDINLFYYRYFQDYFATKFLFDSITGEKVTLKSFDKNYVHPNIGAIQLNKDTTKYISDVIRTLFLPWKFIVPEKITIATGEIIKRKYSAENYDLFQKAITQVKNSPRTEGLRILFALLKFMIPNFVWVLLKYTYRKSLFITSALKKR